MGKRARVTGLVRKKKRNYGKKWKATVGMLLGAEWDDAYGCFVQRTYAGGHPTVCYYDLDGKVLSKPTHGYTQSRWDRHRNKMAGKSLIGDYWGQKLAEQYDKSMSLTNTTTQASVDEYSHMEDAMSYAMDTIKINPRRTL